MSMTGRYHRPIVIDQRLRSISWDACVNVREPREGLR
jgi:hypothetical protein